MVRKKVEQEADDVFGRMSGLAGASFPESIIPNPGEEIRGTFLRLTRGPTRYGQQPILVFRNEAGDERSLWLLNTAAKSQVAAARPQVGERFVFTMLGRRVSKATGAQYADCRFVTESQAAAEGGDAEPDHDSLFDALAKEAAAPWEE